MPGLSIRRYNPEDYEACIQLYLRNEPGRFPANQLHHFEKYLSEARHGFIVAERDGKVIGGAGINSAGENVHCLCFGLVAPEHQGKRVGSMLLLARLCMAKRVPMQFALLYTVPKSTAFYQRAGFRPYAAGCYPDGVRMDAMYLTYYDFTVARIEKALRKWQLLPESDCFPDPSVELQAVEKYFPDRKHSEITITSKSEGESHRFLASL